MGFMSDDEVEDFRLAPMESAEGYGIARRAWNAYRSRAEVVLAPVIEPVAKKLGASAAVDLTGFWLVWHLEGGFEGLQRLGMSRSAIYRRIKLFRRMFKAHPDEFQFPGLTIDLDEYRSSQPEAAVDSDEGES